MKAQLFDSLRSESGPATSLEEAKGWMNFDPCEAVESNRIVWYPDSNGRVMLPDWQFVDGFPMDGISKTLDVLPFCNWASIVNFFESLSIDGSTTPREAIVDNNLALAVDSAETTRYYVEKR